MSSDEQMLDDNSIESHDNDTAVETEVDESSLCAKEAERQRIQAEIEAFLNSGGQITKVETNVTSDPPKRPQSNYGGQPI